jgi:mono/diheme cytochrome c family protein
LKYVFLLVLLIIASAGALLAGVIGYRWLNNMTQTAKLVPGERVVAMPSGVVPRGSLAIGKQQYTTFCVPCHGAEAKGGVTGPVATKFIPTPDLTNGELQRQRTDGYWHSYIVAGGAVMPSYGEALSSQEAWHIVNYLRSLAQK